MARERGGDGILVVDLVPTQRARVLGVAVELSQLLVSVDDPEGLAERLGQRAPPAGRP